jgi:hypothetical protein
MVTGRGISLSLMKIVSPLGLHFLEQCYLLHGNTALRILKAVLQLLLCSIRLPVVSAAGSLHFYK